MQKRAEIFCTRKFFFFASRCAHRSVCNVTYVIRSGNGAGRRENLTAWCLIRFMILYVSARLRFSRLYVCYTYMYLYIRLYMYVYFLYTFIYVCILYIYAYILYICIYIVYVCIYTYIRILYIYIYLYICIYCIYMYIA